LAQTLGTIAVFRDENPPWRKQGESPDDPLLQQVVRDVLDELPLDGQLVPAGREGEVHVNFAPDHRGTEVYFRQHGEWIQITRYNYDAIRGVHELVAIQCSAATLERQAKKLTFEPQPVELLQQGKPQAGWYNVKKVELIDFAGKQKAHQPHQGEIRAFQEHKGNTYALGIVGNYGLEG